MTYVVEKLKSGRFVVVEVETDMVVSFAYNSRLTAEREAKYYNECQIHNA